MSNINYPDWIPHWRNVACYPNYDNTSPRMWAWEYLRRDPSFQRDCDLIGKKWFANLRNQFLKLAALQEDELHKKINPDYSKLHEHNQDIDTTLARFGIAAYEKVTPNEKTEELCEKYKLVIPDHHSQNYPIVVFTTDLNCYRTKTNRILFKCSVDTQYPKAQIFRFKSTQTRLKYKQQRYYDLTKDIFKRDPGGKTHLSYLRILDAFTCGDEPSEIAKVIYGDAKNISAVQKAYDTADEYVKRKYIALPPPFPPKSYTI